MATLVVGNVIVDEPLVVIAVPVKTPTGAKVVLGNAPYKGRVLVMLSILVRF
jgi:hypothetical protein